MTLAPLPAYVAPPIVVAPTMRDTPPPFIWTEKAEEYLRIHWTAGDAVVEIQRATGAPSRQAVIGKAHRLGLGSHPSILTTRLKDGHAALQSGSTVPPKYGRIVSCCWPEGEGRSIRFCEGTRATPATPIAQRIAARPTCLHERCR